VAYTYYILYRCNYTVNAGKLMFKDAKSTQIKNTYTYKNNYMQI